MQSEDLCLYTGWAPYRHTEKIAFDPKVPTYLLTQRLRYLLCKFFLSPSEMLFLTLYRQKAGVQAGLSWAPSLVTSVTTFIWVHYLPSRSNHKRKSSIEVLMLICTGVNWIQEFKNLMTRIRLMLTKLKRYILR